MAIHKIDGVDGTNHFPRKFVTLHCSGAVTKGDWVAIDLDDSTNGLGASVEKATTALPQLVFGVATETLTAAGELVVQVAGKYGTVESGGGAEVATSVAAGDFLVASTAAAGTAVEADSATAVAGNSQANIQAALKLARIGVALAASGGGDYDAGETGVIIIDQGFF